METPEPAPTKGHGRARLLAGLAAAAVIATVTIIVLQAGHSPRNSSRSGSARSTSVGGSSPRTEPPRIVAPTAGAEPIVFVHGYSAASCPGVDTLKVWAGLERFFAVVDEEPPGEMVTVSYYTCDTNGYDIAGTSATHANDFVATRGRPSGGYPRSTPIETLARNLAWFVYRNYTRRQRPANLVGHSMGGLIIRAALQQVQAHDPAYPPSLLVPRVVTLSSPFGGYVWPGCHDRQCREFAPRSAFLTDLNANPDPQGTGGTNWTVIGSTGCDMVTAESATHMDATAIVYTSPSYVHTGYLADLSRASDAIATGPAAGRHAIAEVWAALHD